MYPSVHWGTVYNSYDMKATYMFMVRGMDKEDVVYIYAVIY